MFKYYLLWLLPKNIESYIFGFLSRVIWPSSLVSLMKSIFAKYSGMDLSEAEKSIESYRSLEELFTRKLKPGLRTFDGEYCCPCDSELRYSVPVEKGQLIQAKGIDYSVSELLKLTEAEEKSFKASWYFSFYLSPKDYHRVHAPFRSKLVSVRYIPGQLWPVNDAFTNMLPKLFCRNERVVFQLEDDKGKKAFLCMVGALNVGRIKIKGLEFVTNHALRQVCSQKTRTFTFAPHREVNLGEELGTFMLGSTVLLVLEDGFAEGTSFKATRHPIAVKLGESLVSK